MNFQYLFAKENFVLAAVPVIGFVLALAFEYGYASHFGYPLSLVVIDLRMTVTSTVLAGVYLYFVASFLRFLYVEVDRIPYVGQFLGAIRYSLVIGLVVIFVTGFHPSAVWPTAFFVAANILLVVIVWGCEAVKMGPKDAMVRAKAALNSTHAIDESNVLERIKAESLLLLVLLALVFGAGRVYAVNKAEYAYFEADSKSYAIAAIYGDSVVGVAFTDAGFEEGFAVIGKDDEPMRKLGIRKVTSFKEKKE